jgi:hypothetical protein
VFEASPEGCTNPEACRRVGSGTDLVGIEDTDDLLPEQELRNKITRRRSESSERSGN